MTRGAKSPKCLPCEWLSPLPCNIRPFDERPLYLQLQLSFMELCSSASGSAVVVFRAIFSPFGILLQMTKGSAAGGSDNILFYHLPLSRPTAFWLRWSGGAECCIHSCFISESTLCCPTVNKTLVIVSSSVWLRLGGGGLNKWYDIFIYSARYLFTEWDSYTPPLVLGKDWCRIIKE